MMRRANPDSKQFRNEDLVLTVTKDIDRAVWDEAKYEAFIDALCGTREYQKDAIYTALRYLLGGEYENLKALAKENYQDNPKLEERYGSWRGMENHLQLPDQLSASLDLATGTGKSFVLYGVATILLAEGAVERVLVLCPSTTIELGLLQKFRQLAGDANLNELLPATSKVAVPKIINANETITPGAICVENYHAVLRHVKSSVRDSLRGLGEKVAVLNDEVHHVANDSAAKAKAWKNFLSDPEFNFKYVLGVSGTCYLNNDYFSDVIYRYSLRQAMEERYVKKVDYAVDTPLSPDPDEQWQLIVNLHEDSKAKLKPHNLKPLTIVVTPTIKRCGEIADELKSFLVEEAGVDPHIVDDLVLVVHSDAPDLKKLPAVDNPSSKVEWIVSVSMLNEGWDVKRVFQIVPHEERAFNSKLLISQVLGRGLRVPEGWQGEQPVVRVFNHDAWAPRIRQLVNEILELEKRIPSKVIEGSPYHFDLVNIDYTRERTTVTVPMDKPYTLLAKGYVDLASDPVVEEVSVEFERAGTQESYKWQTKVQHRTYTPKQIAMAMYSRLEEADEEIAEVGDSEHKYTDEWTLEKLEALVEKSLKMRNAQVATESMRQKFLQAIGVLGRGESKYVRYTPIPSRYYVLNTSTRQSESVSAAELRSHKTLFCTKKTKDTLVDEQLEFFEEVIDSGSGFKCQLVSSSRDFKTPLNAVIADHENERKFIKMMLEPANLGHYEAWLKSTTTRFYEIEYAWKKREHPKLGRFSPDFFIKTKDMILVVEIKGDEEIREPSEENRKKNAYAKEHFARVNEYLEAQGESLRYGFHFLTPTSFNKFFTSLRAGTISDYRSELDVKLDEPE